MLMPEPIQLILDRVGGDIDLAAEEIYSGSKPLAIYLIILGLNKLRSRQRQQRRTELRREIRPQYVRGSATGSIQFSRKTKIRLFKQAEELLGENGWNLGEVGFLVNLTKEALLDQAWRERQSAKGHLRNAQWYEALAEPLQPGQIVRDYWNAEAAIKLKQDIWADAEGKSADLIGATS